MSRMIGMYVYLAVMLLYIIIIIILWLCCIRWKFHAIFGTEQIVLFERAH